MVYTERDAVDLEGEIVDPATDVTNFATDATHPAREVANQTMEHATLMSHDWTTFTLEVSPESSSRVLQDKNCNYPHPDGRRLPAPHEAQEEELQVHPLRCA
jgi:hypothetical protein